MNPSYLDRYAQRQVMLRYFSDSKIDLDDVWDELHVFAKDPATQGAYARNLFEGRAYLHEPYEDISLIQLVQCMEPEVEAFREALVHIADLAIKGLCVTDMIAGGDIDSLVQIGVERTENQEQA